MFLPTLYFDSMPDLLPYLRVILEAARASGRSEREISRAAIGQPGALSLIKTGRVPSVERTRLLCETLGLEFYVGPPQGIASLPEPRSYDPAIDDAEHVMVPKLSVRLVAGHGAAASDEEDEPVALLAFRHEWMQRYGLQPGQVSAVEIAGDSMEPLLIDGDTVLVDHCCNEARQGKVFAVRNMDDLLVKRLERKPDNKWILTSDNKDYEPIDMGPQAILIGEVVWRGTWLGEKMASKKQIADLGRLLEILAKHRVDTGAAADLDQAKADIEAEMMQDGVLDEDGG